MWDGRKWEGERRVDSAGAEHMHDGPQKIACIVETNHNDCACVLPVILHHIPHLRMLRRDCAGGRGSARCKGRRLRWSVFCKLYCRCIHSTLRESSIAAQEVSPCPDICTCLLLCSCRGNSAVMDEGEARTLHAISAIYDCSVYVRVWMFVQRLLSCKTYGVRVLSVKDMVCVCVCVCSLSLNIVALPLSKRYGVLCVCVSALSL